MSDDPVRTVALCRSFGTTKALKNLDLVVPKGSFLTLLGPNGAGKTTLLRLLMGLIEPTSGEAFVFGSPVRSLPPEVSSRVAYVGDRCEPPHWATLALLEDLQASMSEHFDRALFRDLCSQRSLSPRRRYESLSKGQGRWVLTSLALASRPKLILLDEPADGLDPAARRDLYNALRSHANQSEAAVIVTTHVIADVERVCDDVAILHGGRLILHAPLDDLRDDVRQIEIQEGDVVPYLTEPDLGEQAAILGRLQRGTTTFFWLKRNGLGEDDLRSRFGANATIRTVGLETMYLAMTEYAGDEKTHPIQQEVA
jgi:ABC-2 type transport system ATP-binding protein